MNREYPRLGDRDKHKPNTGLNCEVCVERQAKYRQWIQVSWFRGDDEKVDLCEQCKVGPEWGL